MTEKDLRKEYVRFLVRTGLNLQPGQTMILNSPAETADIARLCAEEAFAAGARDVVVHYNDEQINRIRMKHASPEALQDVKPWLLSSYMDYAEAEGGVCVLSLISRDPKLYEGMDAGKIGKAGFAQQAALKPWRDLFMSNQIQWCNGAVPTNAWARCVFPDVPDDEAKRALWDAILQVCRADGGDTVKEWKEHARLAAVRRARLQEMNLSALRLSSESSGTNLSVGLAEGHIFGGIESLTADGLPFISNVPTEEIFTAPHKERVNGIAKSTRPYVYNGNIIEGITMRFKDGEVYDYSAERGGEFLRAMFESDKTAKRPGEIALVPASGPIGRTGLLFYIALYDENAACHIGFGKGYASTIEGGASMGADELLRRGLNDSFIHEDIMIGTDDMEVTGISKSGEEFEVFKEGEWVF